MALFIARHGQTDWNASGRYQARTDVPINATGQKQAALLRDLFAGQKLQFQSAHCSPLSRARETASIMLSDSSTPLLIEQDLLEMDLGEWEGRYAEDLIAEFGDDYHSWRNDGYIKAVPGGESMLDVIERVKATVHALAERAKDADILIVAHQATNMGIKAALSGDTQPETLRWYRQSNDEVDVWDSVENRFLDRLSVKFEPDTP